MLSEWHYAHWVPAVAGDLALCHWATWDPEPESSNYISLGDRHSANLPPPMYMYILGRSVSCGLYGDFIDRPGDPGTAFHLSSPCWRGLSSCNLLRNLIEWSWAVSGTSLSEVNSCWCIETCDSGIRIEHRFMICIMTRKTTLCYSTIWNFPG